MKPEIEAKFLHINTNEMRSKLRAVGATCEQPMQLMRRVVFDTPTMNDKHAFLRVRDEGYRVTMTYKQFDEMSLTGAKEIEVNVSDYEAAIALADAIGMRSKCKQLARREIWKLGKVEIVIDEWPWIDPFIEIEAATEALVKKATKQLGFDWQDAVFGDVMTAYRAEYPNTSLDDAVYNLPRIVFGDPVPEMLKV